MKFFENSIVRVVIAVVLGLLVLNFEPYIERLITIINPQVLKAAPWVSPSVESLSMLLLSILIILIITRGQLTQYGFTLGKNVRYLKIVVLSLIAGVVIMMITGIMASLLQSMYPAGGGEHFASSYSLLETIIFVWVLASISEEVLTRGLIQGYLAPLNKYGFKLLKIYISIPALISALFFAAMHLMLLTTGMNIYMVFSVVISTFVLGLIAGYYREQTNSLIPAIIVHMIFNIGGTVLGTLSQFMS